MIRDYTINLVGNFASSQFNDIDYEEILVMINFVGLVINKEQMTFQAAPWMAKQLSYQSK